MSLTLRLLNYGEPPPERLSVTFDERGGTIGRGPENDWSIPDSQKQVSRVHAVIEYRGGAYFIIDKSANGIFRNDEPHALAANHPVAISDGDRLTLGNFTAVVSIDWAAMAAPTADRTRAFVPRDDRSADGFGLSEDSYDSPNPFAPAFEPQAREASPELNIPGIPEPGAPAAGVPDVLDLVGGAPEGDALEAGVFQREPGEEFAPAREGLRNTQEQHTPAHREVFDPFKSAGSASSTPPAQNLGSQAPQSHAGQVVPDLPTQWKVRADDPSRTGPDVQPPSGRAPSQSPPAEPAPNQPVPTRATPDSDWKVRDNWKVRDEEPDSGREGAVSDPSAPRPGSGAGVESAERFAEPSDPPAARADAPATVAQAPAAKILETPAETIATTVAEGVGEGGARDISSTAPDEPDEAPEASTSPGAAARASSARDLEAIHALFKGMGLADFKVDDEALPAVMETIGKVFREAVAGTRDVLMVRTRIRNEFRVQHTMLRPKENNPLKFSVTIEDALHKMVKPSSKGFLAPVDAMREAFKDLAGHEVATVTGMRAGIEDVLSRFEPTAIEKRLQRDSLLGSLLPATRKARLWELFVDNYETIMHEAEGDFEELFGREFAQAYEREMEQVRRASAAARNKPKG